LTNALYASLHVHSSREVEYISFVGFATDNRFAAGPGLLLDLVLDLRWIKWEKAEDREETTEAKPSTRIIDNSLPSRNAS
jgi:hypothetical protein